MFSYICSRSESDLVEEIARVTLSKLRSMSTTTTTTTGHEEQSGLVGAEGRLKKIESLLSVDSRDVRIIGIWGMGGIGKSTLAQVVQKRLSSNYESCFFGDISDEVKRFGLQRLANEFFATLLKERDIDMTNQFEDVRLRRTKVFVVLDNAEDQEHVECLIGASQRIKARFGVGSRIVLTSRDKKLLEESADFVYEVDTLDSAEATALFELNAFRRDSSKITSNYKGLSKKVVDYCGGNPLALKVLGSYLSSRSIREWESALSELEKAPNQKVQNVLRISYDGLDRGKRSVFLDVACFFKWEDREFVEESLEADSHVAISVLVERSLVTIVEGRLYVHDLIQEMAWEIARQESTKLGKRSRLWTPQDAFSVLEKNPGSARIEGIFLDMSKISKDLYLSGNVFEEMENLRLLRIYNSDLDEKKVTYCNQDLQCLPDTLRYLDWVECPMKSFPSNFEPQYLVKLSMPNTKLLKLWDGVKPLRNLKHIKLSGSSELSELPDLSEAPKLERMDLSFCTSLRWFPKISGNLNHLDMQFSGIEKFHPSFDSLENLHHLNLSYCESLTSLPNLPRNLRTLNLTGGKSLMNLNMPITVSSLHSLTNLELSACGISHIPDSLTLLSSIESLNISGNIFEAIPLNMKQMSKLKNLKARYCESLKALPDLPSSMQELDVRDSVSVTAISLRELTKMKKIEASGCKSLSEIIVDERGCGSWEELLTNSRKAMTVADGSKEDRTCSLSFLLCSKLEQRSRDNVLTLFQRQVFGVETAFHLDFDVTASFESPFASAHFPGNEIPNWFNHQSEGSSISLSLKQSHNRINFIGFAAAAVIELENATFEDLTLCYVSAKSSIDTVHKRHNMDCLLIPLQHYVEKERIGPHVLMWHCYSGFSSYALEASIEFKLENEPLGGKIKMKRCGVHVITLDEVQEFGFDFDIGKVHLRKLMRPTESSQKNVILDYSRRLRTKKFISEKREFLLKVASKLRSKRN